MTTATCNADIDPADHTRREDQTIVVTLSVVDVEFRRRTEPGSTISRREFFAPEAATPTPSQELSNGETRDSSARTSQSGPESGAGVGARPDGAPLPSLAEQCRGGKIYTVEMADRIARELRALPAIDRRRGRKQAVVRCLKEQIAIVQRRGYTLEEIAEHLTGAGFEITARTLKSYLHRAKRRSGKRTATRWSGPLVLREGVS